MADNLLALGLLGACQTGQLPGLRKDGHHGKPTMHAKTTYRLLCKFAEGYDLTEDEREALLTLNIGELYAQGVHGLILRPFTLLHSMPEPDYLKAIRGEK